MNSKICCLCVIFQVFFSLYLSGNRITVTPRTMFTAVSEFIYFHSHVAFTMYEWWLSEWVIGLEDRICINVNACSSRSPYHKMNGLECLSSFLSIMTTTTILSLGIVLTLSKINIPDIDYTVCSSFITCKMSVWNENRRTGAVWTKLLRSEHSSLILIPLVVRSTKKYIDCVFCQCDKIVVTLAEVGSISADRNNKLV